MNHEHVWNDIMEGYDVEYQETKLEDFDFFFFDLSFFGGRTCNSEQVWAQEGYKAIVCLVFCFAISSSGGYFFAPKKGVGLAPKFYPPKLSPRPRRRKCAANENLHKLVMRKKFRGRFMRRSLL